MILGIDEAGRGCVLGPLVVCGFALREGDLPRLEALGLADSKALSPDRREALAGQLRRFPCRILLMKFPPSVVDSSVARGGLNAMEVSAMVRLIRRVKPSRVFIDALTSNPRKFGAQIGSLIAPLVPRITAENRADAKYPAVMAASILAKVARDASIGRISRLHGDIGSGYPGDPKTRAFIAGHSSTRRYPACVRKSWATVGNIEAESRGKTGGRG